MRVTIDHQANALYIYFLPVHEDYNGKLKTIPTDENMVFDLTEDGKLFGIEILSLEMVDLNVFNKIEVEVIG